MRAAELGEEITATPWEWEPRPDVWLLVLCVAAAYWWATTRLRARLVGQPAAPSARERLRFALGLALHVQSKSRPRSTSQMRVANRCRNDRS